MLLDIWEAALKAKVGIAVPTNNRKVLQQHLYRARAEANDPKFEEIVIIMPEKEDELWLVHKDADSPSPGNEGNIKSLYP
jgi:hypothetical protein